MSKAKGYLYGSISSATFGLIPLFTLPVMAKGIQFDSILFFRFLFASLTIGGVMLARGESFRIKRTEIGMVVLLGALYSASALFLFWSYNFMDVGVASTILFIYPVMVAVVMATFFREKVSWITTAAILAAFAGVGLLYMGDPGGVLSTAGIVVIMLSALSYALYIVGVNKSRISTMSGTKLTFYALLVGLAMFYTKAQAGGGIQLLPDWQSWANIVILAVVPTVVSCITMVLSVHHIGSTNTAVLGALEPVTAVCVGVLVFSEPFTSNLALGIVLIISAVTLIILGNRIRRYFGQLGGLLWMLFRKAI